MTEGSVKLWSEVMGLAVEDALGRVHQVAYTRKRAIIEDAQTWFKSNNKEGCSFLWVCVALDLEPSNIRKKLYPLFAEAH